MSFQNKLFVSLPLLAIAKGHGQEILRYRAQYYGEDDGRMEVESHYLDYKHRFDVGTTLGLRLAIDTLSGQTPIGTHASLEESDWNFQDISDERTVEVITVEHEIDDYTLSFEYAHSKESDYGSNAFSLRLNRDLFSKNTLVSAGASFAFDEVLATPFTSIAENQDKDSIDFSLAVSQVLGPNTVVDLNFGYGHSAGYLSDPYRQISQTSTVDVVTPVGTFLVTDTFDFPENRPDTIDRWVARIAAKHYFESASGALHGSYRFFANSNSLTGHTFELKWVQEFAEQWIVTPYLRYYQQKGADFYQPFLTGSGIDGHGRNDGKGPFYSSDYRLSALDSLTYGLQFSYFPVEEISIDLQLERYEMSGRQSSTPSVLFPSANVISLGLQCNF